MEKYFDAKDMRNVIDDIEWLFSGYREHSDGLIGCYEKYRDNDLFQGAVAEASKLFIGKHQITQAKAQVAMQQKLLDMYKHALTSFHEKVDKAPDARVDLETLDIVNKDFQDIYADLDEYVKYIEKVVKLLQARYGFLGIFTMPKCQPALDTFTALCGGDNPRSGFIYDLMQKFINYDADECAYADSLNFEQEIDDENDKIQAATNLLEGYQTVKPSDSTSNVTHTENSNSTAETTSGKRDEFAVVQERYGFTEEEMEYLKKNYPSLVISLYGASSYSTSDADKILQQIKEKLEKYQSTPEWYGNPMQLDGNSEQEKFLAERLGKLKLPWNQEKVDQLWAACEEIYNEYGINIDPRLLLAIIIQEGTGSFNTSSTNLAADGQNGVETDYVKDLMKANNLVFGKIIGYMYYHDQFEQAVADCSPLQGEGGVFDYINWNTPIVSFKDGKVRTGVYAGHSAWGNSVENLYEKLTYEGAGADYTEYVSGIDKDKVKELIGDIDMPEYNFVGVQEGQDSRGNEDGSWIIKVN